MPDSEIRSPEEETVEREFLETAVRRAEFLRSGQPKKANKEYARLYALKGRIRRLKDRGEAALKRIANDSDPEVQISAAALLLAIDELFATELLERIQKSDIGLPSFTAEMTLREWRKGAIREYLS